MGVKTIVCSKILQSSDDDESILIYAHDTPYNPPS